MEPYTIVRTTTDLRRAIDERRREIGLTMLELDDAAGVQSGYSSKLLGPGRMKCFGEMSLKSLLGALGLKLVVALEDAPHLLEESAPIGDLALSSLLGVLGLRLALVADDALIPALTRRLQEARLSAAQVERLERPDRRTPLAA
ncbi:MAG: hypothetical protein U1E20_06295 [Methylocystis sp.]|uniref:hypothetical protein n=1 Tax=Methylocystis sp. TaxID=1911079 RepID=UPI003957AF55